MEVEFAWLTWSHLATRPSVDLSGLDFDGAMLKKITDAYAANFVVPCGFGCNEVVDEVVKLIQGRATLPAHQAVAAEGQRWVETRVVSMPQGVLMSHAYDFDGWESERMEMHTPHGSFAVWPDQLNDKRSWSMCGGPSGIAKIGHYGNEQQARADAEMVAQSLAAPVPPFSAAEQPKNSSALAGKFWARIALATTLPEHEISTLAHDLEKIAAAHLARQAQAGAEIRPEVVERFADYSKIAHLIGSIFFAGDFRAETANERDLEALLVKTGHRYASWEEVGLFRADDLPVEFLAAPTQGSAPQAERVVPGSQEK